MLVFSKPDAAAGHMLLKPPTPGGDRGRTPSGAAEAFWPNLGDEVVFYDEKRCS